jgi:DNA-binding NtrC family response regulator
MRIPPARVTSGFVYVVDDEPHLAELYTIILEAADCRVRTFRDRREALDALRTAHDKPDLLITDYDGHSMPVDAFMHQCLMIHPALRILMVSGFNPADVRFSQARPNRYMQKPFRLEHLEREVRAALAA